MPSLALTGALALVCSLVRAQEESFPVEGNGCLGKCGLNTVCGPADQCEKGTCPPVFDECCKGPVCEDNRITSCVGGFDPFCHTDWDGQCVGEAQERCGLQCEEPPEKTYSKTQFISYPMTTGYNEADKARATVREEYTCTQLMAYLKAQGLQEFKRCNTCRYANDYAKYYGLASGLVCGWKSIETGCEDITDDNTIPNNECPQYYPSADDYEEDMRDRLQLMRQAVDTAKNSAAVNHDPEVLKIFMAPEFYFRGSTGAYTVREILFQTNFLQTLREIASDPAFDDWVFVFGTIIASEKLEEPEAGKEYKTWNCGVIERGMRPSQEKIIFKNYLSDIDFITNLANGQDGITMGNIESCTNKECVYEYPTDEILSPFDLKMVTGNVFHMAGIKFGIEVCLDHLVQELHDHLPPGESVQVQLVTSAGMSPKRESIRLPVGGVFYITDGLSGTSGQFMWTVTSVGPNGHPANYVSWKAENATAIIQANAMMTGLVRRVFQYNEIFPEIPLLFFPAQPIAPL